jgi:hypothetical protein
MDELDAPHYHVCECCHDTFDWSTEQQDCGCYLCDCCLAGIAAGDGCTHGPGCLRGREVQDG